MPKDTKSLDNNKAPACESRGFVHKKEGVHFDTPSFFNHVISSIPTLNILFCIRHHAPFKLRIVPFAALRQIIV